MVSMLAFKDTIFTHTAGDEHDKRFFFVVVVVADFGTKFGTFGRCHNCPKSKRSFVIQNVGQQERDHSFVPFGFFAFPIFAF